MIRRLVEVNYNDFYDSPNPARIRFWLEELRTPELLVEAASRFPTETSEAASPNSVAARLKSGLRFAGGRVRYYASNPRAVIPPRPR